jgi:GT2 family glycosyltransferase
MKGNFRDRVDVSFIIITYNSENFIRPCLESIYRNTVRLQYEVIVVDNASKDRTVPILRAEYPRIRLIINRENRGFAAANNQAVPLAKGNYLLLLNADTELLDEGLSDALDFARSNNVAILGPKTFGIGNLPLKTWKEHNTIIHHAAGLLQGAFHLQKLFRPAPIKYDRQRKVEFLVGAALLVDRTVAVRYGLFDERFFFNGEDLDLGMRYSRAGLTIVYFPKWTIFHHVHAGISLSIFHYITWIKADLILAQKHGGITARCMMKAVFFVYTISIIFSLLIKCVADPRNNEKRRVASDFHKIFLWLIGVVHESKITRSLKTFKEN